MPMVSRRQWEYWARLKQWVLGWLWSPSWVPPEPFTEPSFLEVRSSLGSSAESWGEAVFYRPSGLQYPRPCDSEPLQQGQKRLPQ